MDLMNSSIQPLFPGFEMKAANASITEWLTEGNPNAFPRPRWTLARFNDPAHFVPEKLHHDM